MAETANIAKVADIISNEIFLKLKWEQRPHKDTNWNCVNSDHNVKTHPSDIVFHYKDPYTGNNIYINTDLKSYKDKSISKPKIRKALTSLSISVDCANISSDWSDKFILDKTEENKVIGMLFIYNHDNSYCNDFSKLLKDISPTSINLAPGNQIVVFGPEKIRQLYNIVTDIKLLKSEELFLTWDDYTFFYPDLVLYKRSGDEWGQPASIEALTAPWIILKYRVNNNFSKSGYIVYYNRHGNTIEEFIYLLDTLSHYQMLLSNNDITIKLLNPHDNAIENIEKAKHQYLQTWGFDEHRKSHLDKIKTEKIKNFITDFDLQEVGMRDAK